MIVDILPETLQNELKMLPDPDSFIIRVLKQALDMEKQNQKIRSIRGKYKNLPTGSEYFSKRKQQEIQIER